MKCAGTLRPDLIESASEMVSETADTIKTHHNDTDLVRQLRQQVIYLFTYSNYIIVLPWVILIWFDFIFFM